MYTNFQKKLILHVQSGMNVMCMSVTYPFAPGLPLLSSFKEKTIRSDNELADLQRLKRALKLLLIKIAARDVTQH